MKALITLLRGSETRLAASAAAGAGTVAGGIGLLATAAYLIVRADQHPPILELTVAIVGVRFFGIARAVLRYVERLVAHDTALRLGTRLRVRTFAALERQAPASLADADPGDLIDRIGEDLDAVQNTLVRSLLPLVVTGITVLGAGAGAAAILPVAGWCMALIMSVTALGVGLVALLDGRTARRRLAPARAELARIVVDLAEGTAEAIAFGRAPALLQEAAQADARLTRQARLAARTSGVGAALAIGGSAWAIWLTLRLGVEAIAAGDLDPVMLGALALLVLAAFEPVMSLPAGLTHGRAGVAAARRLTELEDRPDPIPSGTRNGAPLPPLEFGGVSLRHRPDGPWALRDVDLRLEPGRRVALVGESGAGKSTVATALLRFCDIDTGRYSAGGVDVGEFTPEAIRRVVGLAAEDAHLIDGTLEENLRMARPDATTGQLWDAVAAAHLTDWVHSLPQGLQTPVGPRASGVSGGERRRISLARALLADFAVLVVDEPTAGLDPESAQLVVESILEATRQRGLLLITHGTEGLQEMDEIIVLHEGRILERGDHRALMASGNRYASFQRARS